MSQRNRSKLQYIVEDFLTSGLSSADYVQERVNSGKMDTSEAIELLYMLQKEYTPTFKLKEITEEKTTGLSMALFQILSEKKSTDTNPIFRISFDPKLNIRKYKLTNLLQEFAKSVALLTAQEAQHKPLYTDYTEKQLH